MFGPKKNLGIWPTMESSTQGTPKSADPHPSPPDSGAYI